ncbi:MAG: glycosyl hydrolase [Verrucomicrobiota bacterium]
MKLNRRTFLGTSTAGLVGWLELPASGLLAAAAGGVPTGVKEPARPRNSSTLETLKALWDKPERTHKPHTRWWWPGNALSPADITRQLEGMAGQGIGGVEIMSLWKMYEKGNAEYLTPEFLALVKHAVAEAKRLDIEVAITFSPGWGFGGAWVPQADQSKVLCLASRDLADGTKLSGTLPRADPKGVRSAEAPQPSPPGTLVAVVAGRLTGKDQLDADSLIDLTKRVNLATTELEWEAPPGEWRLLVFWLEFTGQVCSAQSFEPPPMVIDHLNRAAVQRYCEHLGGVLEQTVGDEFGRNVDSFFCDSFEFWPLSNALLWSTDTLAGFERHAGYDLTKYLAALWYDVGPLTPRIRYDLGEYLSYLGLEAFFKPFNDWCVSHHVQARIQPHYRFSEELVQGAGACARPETEVTTARFEPVADPRKATASGARFYGREIVSAEAYTFIHPLRYRTNLQDLKIATDAFLRDGITQFYNHGYFGSPEMHVAPSRDFPWANRIDHWNTWWPHYHFLAAYVARCCAILRQGRLVADVLIYSPQASAWSERAVWGSTRRVMPYGNLAKTLVANGYDFDIVNDDLLQHRAMFRDGRITLNGHTYRLLVLPRATVLPIETLRTIRDFLKVGGTVVALDELPDNAAGLKNHESNDRELRQIIDGMFSNDPARLTGGIFLPEYKIERKPFNPGRQAAAPTPPLNAAQRRLLGVLEGLTPPDFALADRVQSDGLTYIHKQVGDVDIYFVSNLQAQAIATEVTFRVTGKILQRWDARSGTVEDVRQFRATEHGSIVALAFEPWESALFVFRTGVAALPPVTPVVERRAVPEPLVITGTWQMKLAGYGFSTYETTCNVLASWTDSPRTCHFSGTGHYQISFDVPIERLAANTRILLDLGAVGNLAEVEVNGLAVGVAWMQPYRLDVTRALRAGSNQLVVRVSDALINYVSGLKEPTEVPLELQARLGQANAAIYPQGGSASQEMSETDLPPSGLLGPVRLVFGVL